MITITENQIKYHYKLFKYLDFWLNYVFDNHLNLSYQQQVWIEVMLRQKMETIAIRSDVQFVTRSRISPLLMSCLQRRISIHKWIELSEIWYSTNPPLEYIGRKICAKIRSYSYQYLPMLSIWLFFQLPQYILQLTQPSNINRRLKK